MKNDNDPKPSISPNHADRMERLAMRLQELADTPHASFDDTQLELDNLEPEKLEKIQNVVSYVDRIASLASVVGKPTESLGKQDHHLGTFGRFELLGELGAGGFAQVYLAHDPSLDRLVALKIPHLRKLTNDNARLRFQREARAAALLSHPSIVPIFEAGVADDVAYIASEFCEGETLSDWIQKTNGPAEPKFAASLVATLADAMQYSHTRGIVHRDLKPTNIVLNAVDVQDGQTIAQSARILDFGLAKPLFEEGKELTQEGDVVGTPAYMAPELISGNNTTSQSDIYSLGVILYLLLTEQLPHTGQTTLKILRAVESETPVLPRKIVPTIPRDLEAVTMKCLRKNPDDRYQNALELHADLTNWSEGRPVAARSPTTLERVGMWYAREPKFANALILAMVTLVAGIGATAWQWQKAVLYRHEAQERLAEAKRGQEMIAANLSEQARVTVSIFDEYSNISDWMKKNPSGEGLRERIQQAADNVNESEGKEETGENWMGMSDKQMDMGAGLAVMMLCRDYWKQRRFDDAVQLVMGSTKTHQDNRVCVGIYGGTLSYLYGRHDKDRQILLEAGYSETEISEQQESLRLASLDCLKRASNLGSLWLDREHWGAIYEDREFQKIVRDSRYPIVFDKMSSKNLISSVTKGFVSQGFKSLFGGAAKSDEQGITNELNKPPSSIDDSQDKAE